MTSQKINLACGSHFVSGDGWVNLDFISRHKEVQQANILKALPFRDHTFDLVYSSHFLEHIPYSLAPSFLAELRRIVKPTGLLRLVTPDFYALCSLYISYRDLCLHSKADLICLEILDQCVRQTVGGRLANFYESLRNNTTSDDELISFLYSLNGELINGDFLPNRNLSLKSFLRYLKGSATDLWIKTVIQLLPSSFRNQNVLMTSVGERHHWLYDFHQLKSLLFSCGFRDIVRCSHVSSSFPSFPFCPLDADINGMPRKGIESMYIEAIPDF